MRTDIYRLLVLGLILLVLAALAGCGSKPAASTPPGEAENQTAPAGPPATSAIPATSGEEGDAVLNQAGQEVAGVPGAAGPEDSDVGGSAGVANGGGKSSSAPGKGDSPAAGPAGLPPGKAPASFPERPTDPGFYERTDSQGGVDITVIWLTPEYLEARSQQVTSEQAADLNKNFVFNLAFDTHSGDLLGFNMAQAARLEVNGRDAGPGTWQLVSQSSHHPEGQLRFVNPVSGEPVENLRLTISNLRGVAVREFVWDW